MTTQRPIGYFVHHQGRGHAIRAAAVANALPEDRPVTLFCARDDIFPPLRQGVEVRLIPSLFERRGDEATGADWVQTPDTLHCAPVGWPGIREATGLIVDWFRTADPVLMISDVSVEIAQLARICSVPHVMVQQHGDRSDAGHRAAYDGAVGVLAPFASELAQPEWDDELRAKTYYAGGLGAECPTPDRATAQCRSKRKDGFQVLVVSGGGGEGVTDAPLGVAARTYPQWQWTTIGEVRRDWHATLPGNLSHLGWVDDAADRIAAADLVVASAGNTTCQQILSAARPWLVVPEWRYFDEQAHKADALMQAGVAHYLPALPSSAHAWRAAIHSTLDRHDPDEQRQLAAGDAGPGVARWLEGLIDRLWVDPTIRSEPMPHKKISVLSIAKGRAEHLSNVVRGLAQQKVLPDEVIVSVMQNDLYDLPDAPFPIRQLRLGKEGLPLAAARNKAADAATGDILVFLDVDCIPHPDLVADYATAAPNGGLLMGEVLYLPSGATQNDLDMDHFNRIGQRHSDRRGPPAFGVERCKDYRCFWSLNFAMTREAWLAVGGFDTRFSGYGGEDTDFGRMVDEAGLPIWWMKGARAYHQYHPHAMPPVHHLSSVLKNAEVFAQKWGHRTMEHWLRAFQLMGLIKDTPDGLRIIREPGEAELNLCRQQADQPYASSTRILEFLELEAAEKAASSSQMAAE